MFSVANTWFYIANANVSFSKRVKSPNYETSTIKYVFFQLFSISFSLDTHKLICGFVAFFNKTKRYNGFLEQRHVTVFKSSKVKLF